jgi:chromosome segregation ATPase
MVCCSLAKKAVLGTALAAGSLYLLFGTSAPSYMRTAFHKVRHTAKNAVPVQFDIDRAREEIANLEPAIKDNIESLARAEVETEHLEREIATVKDNLAREKKAMLALREGLDSGDYRLTGHVNFTADEIKGELAHRLDRYRNVAKILDEKEATLKAKQKTVIAARKQLANMAAQKKALLTKLEGIEAHLRMIEATNANNEFDFDASALARAKSTVADLEKRLEIMERKAEMEGHFVESGVPIAIEPGRDVIKEIDEEFGQADKSSPTKPTDKSL